MLTYYTGAPVLPVPGQTNSTIVMIMYWAKKYVFDNFNNGNNSCGDAYKYVWVYLAMILAVVALNFVVFVIGAIGELARQRAPNRKMYRPLEGTTYPTIACAIAVTLYICAIMGKMFAGWTSIDSIREYDKTPAQTGTSCCCLSNSYSIACYCISHHNKCYYCFVYSLFQGSCMD